MFRLVWLFGIILWVLVLVWWGFRGLVAGLGVVGMVVFCRLVRMV
jgi:hypothetical protein